MQLLIKYIKPYFGKMSAGFAIKFIGTMMDLLIPYYLAYIIDTVTPKNDVGLVVIYGIIMLVCAVVAVSMNIIANRMASAVARDTTKKIRHDLFEKTMNLSNRKVDAFTIPSLVSRMTTDTYNINRMIGMMQRIGIRAPLLVIGGVAITAFLDPILSLLLCCMLPLIAAVVYVFSKRSLLFFAKLQISVDGMVRVVRESIIGIRVIKALGRTEEEKKHFAEKNSKIVSDETKANTALAVVNPAANFILNAGLVLVIAVGAWRVNSGNLEIGTIVAFLSYFTIILNAIMMISRILTMYTKALASADRIEEVLKSDDETLLIPSKYNFESEKETSDQDDCMIRFENVSFSYNKKSNDLENISFSVKRGESLGIIGSTGAGKSTVIALMLKLYDADSGSIYVCGKNIADTEPGKLRNVFGAVFQNDVIFKDTIGENITLGRKIAFEDIERAARTAQAEEFIESKKDSVAFSANDSLMTENDFTNENSLCKNTYGGGYDFEVAIGGANLSGGQKQRLLIARALAGKPDILVLDDSSSALDYKTDANMRAALSENYGKTTTVIVAQRISSVMHCNKIIVLDGGREVGYGTHDELIKSCQMYIDISKIQLES